MATASTFSECSRNRCSKWRVVVLTRRAHFSPDMGYELPIIYLVAGARPNFMKIAPIIRAIEADGRLRHKLIHTGQHYDRDMNDVFFEELGIPKPDVFMGCGSGSHAQQTAKIMIGFEELCAAG